MTLRAILYARYSTDKQRETSIEDQLRDARDRAAREGWQVVAQHGDEGVSGSTPVALRKGGKALLADALAGRFDVLIVEGLDRLSREIGEAETITKRLEHRGVRIIGTADGYDSNAQGRKVMRIARGLVNELYLDDLREKTHRGLAGQFDRGYHVGGVTFGYRSEPTADGKGRHLVIDEAQAAIVREVFKLFADGHSGRKIAWQLNARGVPSPRGGTWAVSALVGDSKRGAGLLNADIYNGVSVWNRRQWLKDPETGKRRYVDRPRDEWQVRQVPELRIVSPEMWERVRNRARRGPMTGTRTGRGAIPKTLFGGLLRCNACGGPMVAIDRYRYGCNVHKDRGATVCGSGLKVHREAVDRRLVAELRDQLLTPDAVTELQAVVRDILGKQQRDAAGAGAGQRRRLAALDAEIGRLVEAVASVGISAAITDRLRLAEAERLNINTQLREIEAANQVPGRALVEDVVARYKRMLLNLRQVLDEDDDRSRTRQLLADLLGPVVIGADEDGKPWAEIEETTERLVQAVGGSMGLVAGARFELATFGL